MPDASLITVADAIVYELRAASEAGEFNRRFDSNVVWANRDIPLEQTKAIQVDVAPINWSRVVIARGVWADFCRYDIGVRKKFESKPDSSDITDLVTLINDLTGFFMPKQPDEDGRKLSQATSANWISEKDSNGRKLNTDIIIYWDHLQELSQFTGYFPLSYHVRT